MADCKHAFDHGRGPCPHRVSPGSEHCLWHNHLVDKSALYVADLLAQAIRLSGGDLENADLRGLVWPKAALAGVNLRGADLRDCVLPGADLAGADLTGAQLGRAHLHRAQLAKARLVDADLAGAHLGQADLREADLGGAHLDQTVLLGADLRGANLRGARIEAFTWNRLTRFSGVRGLDPLRASGEDDATQRFAAPLAMGEHDISDSRRSSAASDPELERPRLYRSTEEPAPPPRTSGSQFTAVSLPVTASPLAASPAPTPAPARRTVRLLAITAIAACLIAAAATAIAVQARLRPVPTTGPATTHLTQPNQASAGLDERERAAYQARITELGEAVAAAKAAVETQRNRLESGERRLEELAAARQTADLEAARLRERDDDADRLGRELADLRARHQALVADNRRLAQAASIFHAGVERLTGEKERLEKHVYGDQLAKEHRIANLTATVERLENELRDTTGRFQAAAARRDELESELARADRALSAVSARIRGTALEELLAAGTVDQPLLEVRRGRPLALGGECLMTLQLDDDGRDAGLIRVRGDLVLQGQPGRSLPEVGVVLYDGEGHPLGKFSFTFISRPGGGSFASATAITTCTAFPTGVRVLVSRPLSDEQPVAAGGGRKTAGPQ